MSYIFSSGLFTLSSVVYFTGAVKSLVTEGATFDNVISILGNTLYVIAYVSYFISDYDDYKHKKEKELLIVSSNINRLFI